MASIIDNWNIQQILILKYWKSYRRYYGVIEMNPYSIKFEKWLSVENEKSYQFIMDEIEDSKQKKVIYIDLTDVDELNTMNNYNVKFIYSYPLKEMFKRTEEACYVCLNCRQVYNRRFQTAY